MTSFGASLALGSAFELLLNLGTELVLTGCHIESTFHWMSQFNQETVHCCCIEKEKMTLKNGYFFDL